MRRDGVRVSTEKNLSEKYHYLTCLATGHLLNGWDGGDKGHKEMTVRGGPPN